MAEFGYAAAQDIQPGAGAILENVRPCTNCPQLVIHDNMTPNLTLRGIVKSPCCNARAQYNVTFSGNIAVATGGTVGEIAMAISVGGYVRPLTIAMATPAAIGDFWHVSGDTTIDVPVGCCAEVAVVNTSTDTAITAQNLNVKVLRVA